MPPGTQGSPEGVSCFCESHGGGLRGCTEAVSAAKRWKLGEEGMGPWKAGKREEHADFRLSQGWCWTREPASGLSGEDLGGREVRSVAVKRL